MNKQTFVESFAYIADTPGGVDRLRRLILDRAVRGQLAEQRSDDEPAHHLIKRISENEKGPKASKNLRRPRALAAVTDSERTFVAPQGWEWTRMGDVVQIVRGVTFPASAKRLVHSSDTVACLRTTNVQRTVEWNDLIYVSTEYVKHDEQYIVGDEIIISMANSRELVGKVAPVREVPRIATFGGFIAAIRPLGGISRDFILAVLASPKVQAEFRRGANQTTNIANISVASLREMPVAIPPIAEQGRIADRVEELMAVCDELEEQLEHRAEARTALTSATLHRLSAATTTTAEARADLAVFADNIDIHLASGEGDVAALKQVRQTILDLAIRGRLTRRSPDEEPATELLNRVVSERDRMIEAKEIRRPRAQPGSPTGEQKFETPTTWEWATLGQLVLFSDSGWSPVCLPSRRNDESEWGVLKVSAVSWGNFRADEHKLLTPGLVPRPQIEVRDGDFVMSRANTARLVGRSVVVTDPPPRLMLSDKHVRLRFLNRVCAEYVNIVNGSSYARSYYAVVATGTSDSMRNINRDQILALPIPVPPLAEQRRILDVVNALHAHCDDLELQLVDARTRRLSLSESVVAQVVGERS